MKLEQLIDQAKLGDHAAFGMIVSRFQDMAVGYAFSILRDIQMAQDVAQEAFIDAFFKLNQLSVSAAFPGWFRTIIFKHCDRVARKRRVLHIPIDSLQTEDNSGSPLETVTEKELITIISRAIDSLSTMEKQVVTLFYYADQSQKQIAEFLNISIDSVKNRLRTARSKMKKELVGMATDYFMPQRPSRSNDFLISIEERLSNFVLSPKCEAELTEEGLVIHNHEGWSVKTYTAPISIRTQVQTKGTNHVRLYFGTGALHVHWQDGGIEFRDPVTGYPFRKDFLPSSIGDWLDIIWYITEDRMKLEVDGKEVFRGIGNYRGLSAKVGIGSDNLCRHPLIIKSLRVTELHVDPPHEGRLPEYVQPKRGVVYDRLNTAGFNSSQLGCIKGCADFLGIPVSNEWLFGITGQAFLFTVDKGIGGIGQDRSFWVSEKMRKLAGNAGIKIHSLTGPTSTELIGKSWDQARTALEQGLPCYAWEIELQGEYGMVYGFDPDGYLVKGWHGAHGPIDWRTFAKKDTNGNTLSGHIELCWAEPREKSDDRTAIREGIFFALEQFHQSQEMAVQGLLTGVAAYKEWICSLQEGLATAFGTCYHASVWRECRGMAIQFLVSEVINKVNGLAKEHAGRAAQDYQKVYEQLDMIYSDLFPWPQSRAAIQDKEAINDAVQCLIRAREAEQMAVRSLENLYTELS